MHSGTDEGRAEGPGRPLDEQANAEANGEPEPTASHAEHAEPGPTGSGCRSGFAEALAMLARLPLTDAERAEALRRLLADADPAGQ